VEERLQGEQFRALLEAIAPRLALARGRSKLEVNFERGRLRDVVLSTRLTVPEIDALLAELERESG
jgi:hypothetical protein